MRFYKVCSLSFHRLISMSSRPQIELPSQRLLGKRWACPECKPKVCQLQVLCAAEQEVFRLDIQVRNAPGMAVRQRHGGLPGEAQQALMGQHMPTQEQQISGSQCSLSCDAMNNPGWC